MEFILLTVGKTATRYVADGIADYSTRLSHYVPFKIMELKDVRSGKSLTRDRQKQLEGEELLSKVSSSDMLILLDERGKQFSSMEFSSYLQKILSSGRKRVFFAIGGPYGFSDDVYARADSKISLSKMTFNHEMVRLFFIEQIYRGMTILRGEPYHHE